MNPIAAILDVLLRAAAVFSVCLFGSIYVMVGFMAGPMGIAGIVAPTVVFGIWTFGCALAPKTFASLLPDWTMLRLIFTKVPVYAIAVVGIWWAVNFSPLRYPRTSNHPAPRAVSVPPATSVPPAASVPPTTWAPLVAQPRVTQASPAPSFSISVGDSLASVQHTLGTLDAPTPTRSAVVIDERMLAFPNLGIRIFFDAANQVYAVRIEAPYAGSVNGTELHQPRESLTSVLGAPVKTLAIPGSKPNSSFLFKPDASTRLRYDFDADDRVKTIFLSSGTAAFAPRKTS